MVRSRHLVHDRLATQVELFADLMVQMDDPFVLREAILTASSLDDGAFRSLVDAWQDRFDREANGSLAARFADAYTARRAAMLEARRRDACGEADAADVRFLNADAQSFREDAAKVAREPTTEDISPPAEPQPADPPPSVARPSSPPREMPSFVLAAAAPAITPAPIITPAPVIASAPIVARPPAHLAGTMAVSDAIPKSSLPFAPASAPPAPPPPSAASPPSRPQVPTGTADISSIIPRDLLPFPSAPPAERPAPPLEPFSPSSSALFAPPTMGVPVSRPPQHLSGTADISAFVPRAATPFAARPAPPPPAPPPPAAAQLAPRKRLIRFDPQTGQPLPAPIWVDLPPEPEGQK